MNRKTLKPRPERPTVGFFDVLVPICRSPTSVYTRLFFQHFCENSSAKKTQNLPFGQKLKPIFVQKLKLGAAFLNIEKKLDARAGFQYLQKTKHLQNMSK